MKIKQVFPRETIQFILENKLPCDYKFVLQEWSFICSVRIFSFFIF